MKRPEKMDTLLNSTVLDSVNGTFSPYTHVVGSAGVPITFFLWILFIFVSDS